jgi:thiol-disulfide isomerase/thioredoxin
MTQKTLIAVIFFLVFNIFNTKAQGYKIDITIHGWQDTTLILGHYFNKKMLVNDTILIDEKGKGQFEGEEPLPGGVYIIYMPDQKYFDIIIDEQQHFSIEANKEEPVQSLVIKGNDQEKAFNKYQRYIADQQNIANTIQSKIKENADKQSDSIEIWKSELNEITQNVNSYWDKIIDSHKGTFLSSFIKAMREIKLPDFDQGNTPDSIIQWKRYAYFKEHYFDNMDMNDDRLLRTPFFTNKLESFFAKTVFQIPDSIIKESIRVIEMANENKEMEKYLIQFTFNSVTESKIMGMDAAIVALAEKYYLSGYADWVDEEFLTKLEDRVSKIKPNLIGGLAPELKLMTPENHYIRLSEVYANLTILVFWEPDCGHCKKEIPLLKENVVDKYFDKGVKVFAVYTQHEKDEWTDFIAEKQLEEFINVWDPYNQSKFRNLYDIYSTPSIFILDKDKKIIAKRISSEQIPGFIDQYLKNNKTNE